MASSSLSPVPYGLLETNSGFAFISDSGQPYHINFTDGSVYFLGHHFADSVLSFGFTPLQKGSNIISEFIPITLNRKEGVVIEHDPRVEITIVEAVKSVIQNDEAILIYVCDYDDGRQYARSRLFNVWYRTHANKSIIRRDFLIHDKYYSSIMYMKNNKFRKELEDCLPEAVMKIKVNLN